MRAGVPSPCSLACVSFGELQLLVGGRGGRELLPLLGAGGSGWEAAEGRVRQSRCAGAGS